MFQVQPSGDRNKASLFRSLLLPHDYEEQAVGNRGDTDNFQSEISGLVLENASIKHQMDSTHSVK